MQKQQRSTVAADDRVQTYLTGIDVPTGERLCESGREARSPEDRAGSFRRVKARNLARARRGGRRQNYDGCTDDHRASEAGALSQPLQIFMVSSRVSKTLGVTTATI
jgi:hypothetical protein